MSKVDTLLKKATSYEKLALYSDRRSFLQAIAQAPLGQGASVNRKLSLFEKYSQVDIQSQLHNLFTQAYEMIEKAGGNPESVQAAFSFAKDPVSAGQALSKAIMNVLPSITSLGNADVSNKLIHLTMQISNLINSANATQLAQPGAAQPAAESAAKPSSSFPTIDKATQQAIYDFVVSTGVGTSGKIDGILGPNTRKAIEAVKGYFAKLHPQNQRMTDQQAIRAVKFQGR
jgi:hypothetical protein